MGHNNGIITKPINVRADIAYVLGENSPDVGTLCKSEMINIYAKYKPVRWGEPATPNDSYRAALRWGLYINSTLSLSKSEQDPYWKYNRPRGLATYGEYYRVLDFDKYNHKAECPLLPTNLVINDNGQIHIDLTTIMNPSSGVEIPVTSVFDFPDQDYIGCVLWDITRKFGYYLITDVPAIDVVNGTIDTTKWYDFNKNIIELPFSDEDKVEFFWCTNVNTTIYHDQEGDHPEFVRLASGSASTISLMACDKTHGHTVFTIIKFNLNEDIGFVNRNTVVAGSWNANRTIWTLNGFLTDMQVTYSWPRRAGSESYSVDWRLADGDGNIFTGTNILSYGNAAQWYSLNLQNGSKTYTLQQLIDDNYIITLYLSGRLTGSTQWTQFARINYNVQTGEITYS